MYNTYNMCVSPDCSLHFTTLISFIMSFDLDFDTTIFLRLAIHTLQHDPYTCTAYIDNKCTNESIDCRTGALISSRSNRNFAAIINDVITMLNKWIDCAIARCYYIPRTIETISSVAYPRAECECLRQYITSINVTSELEQT